MSFEFKATKEESGNRKIEPGIHEVKIIKIEAVEAEGKHPFLTLTLENTQGQTTDCRLFMSEKAEPYTIETISYIMGALDITTDVKGKTLTETAKTLFKAIGNKVWRHRFTGEEIAGGINKDTGEQKKNWMKPILGRKYSNESITTNPSRLKPLDKTNPYDWKILPSADTFPTTIAGENTVDNDLPF